MRLLLDSHALLWAAHRPESLGRSARAAIEDPDNEIAVSMASAWELTIKVSRGRLILGRRVWDMVATLGFSILPIETRHLEYLIDLPWIHRDPFDRMLVAQARADVMTLVTRDSLLGRYDIPILW